MGSHPSAMNANQWIEIKPEGPIPQNTSGHSAACLGDQMLVFGGYDGKNDLWAYTLKTNQWIEIKPEGPRGRVGHSASCLGDQMLIFGGCDGMGFINDLWAYALKVGHVAPRSQQLV